MLSAGDPVREYVDSAVRHVLLRQGVLGIKVKIMKEWDPTGRQGPKTPLPDVVTVHAPKEDESGVAQVAAGAPAAAAAAAAPAPPATAAAPAYAAEPAFA